MVILAAISGTSDINPETFTISAGGTVIGGGVSGGGSSGAGSASLPPQAAIVKAKIKRIENLIRCSDRICIFHTFKK
jgi:hypothetical protein